MVTWIMVDLQHLDSHRLPIVHHHLLSYHYLLPVDIPPGDYQITAGIYRVSDQKNLMAYDSFGNPLGSEPLLGILRVITKQP